MIRAAGFFRWLGHPFRAARALFPFTRDGRQTLIYLMAAFCAPVLTALVWWAMKLAAGSAQWTIFGRLADKVALALLISSITFAAFVSIRALKVGKNGFEMDAQDREGDAAQTVADAAQTRADEVKA